MAEEPTIEVYGQRAASTGVHPNLPRAELPLALAELHRALAPGAAAFVSLPGDGHRDVLVGAGFAIDRLTVARDGPATRQELHLRRSHTLPDTVGAGMRLLVCGLNPSPYAADTGIGFGRPGNRFWPAAIEAGLVTADRDPLDALRRHRIGMTDLVKRPTRRADELSAAEYRDGLARVTRLVAWLAPAAVCFVGLAGWRAAVDRRAVAGPQPGGIGGRPAYLMPSTSGLNAATRLPDLVDHLRAAAELADRSTTEP